MPATQSSNCDLALSEQRHGCLLTPPSASPGAVLRSDFFDGNADGDTPFSESLFANIVPARRLAADLAVPVEHDVHGLGVRHHLRFAVGLDIVGAAGILTVKQQRDR